MRKIANIIFVLIFTFSATVCNSAQNNDNFDTADSTTKVEKVGIYYFHGTRRCATCIAVGSVSQELVESKYNDNPKVKFIEINIDEPGNEKLAEKFQVSGSGLYVYNGEDIENITAYAFQYARTNPDKLKNKLIELIDKNL